MLSKLSCITSTLLTISRLTSWTTPCPSPSNRQCPRLLSLKAAFGTHGEKGSRKNERTATFLVPTVVTFAGVSIITCPGDPLPSRPKKAAPFAFVPFARKRPVSAPLTTPYVRTDLLPTLTSPAPQTLLMTLPTLPCPPLVRG